jgi:hypothetical protein
MTTAIYRFGASMVSDDRRYVVTMRSASGNRMWLTAAGTWNYLPSQAARFTSDEADAQIKTLVPTDGSVAPAPRKELSQ